MHFLGFPHSQYEYAYAEPGASGRFWLRVGLLGLARLAVWLATRTVYFVDETEYVYVTQFGEPLRLEFESFLRAVRGEAPVPVTGEDGREALAVALDIVVDIDRSVRAAAMAATTRA